MKGSVAIIGAGMAGMTCASLLRAQGHRVDVFERESVLGGRMATLRVERVSYDIGTPYVTARSSEFRRMLDEHSLLGSATKWSPALFEGQRGQLELTRPQNWYVGTPGMNSIVRGMAEDIRVHLEHRVRRIVRTGERWMLEMAGRDAVGPFNCVLITAPAPESYMLLKEHGRYFDDLTRVRMSPCWSVVMMFDDRLPMEFDAASQVGDVLAWVARDSTKPNRRRANEVWVVQAAPDWSRENVEEEAEDVAQDLWNEVSLRFELEGVKPSQILAYRWRHALVERSLAMSAVLSSELMLGAAGDWCLGPRAEAAFESALALARRVNDAFDVM